MDKQLIKQQAVALSFATNDPLFRERGGKPLFVVKGLASFTQRP